MIASALKWKPVLRRGPAGDVTNSTNILLVEDIILDLMRPLKWREEMFSLQTSNRQKLLEKVSDNTTQLNTTQLNTTSINLMLNTLANGVFTQLYNYNIK